jgi:tetratricopeptide (TPR) repeat protein
MRCEKKASILRIPLLLPLCSAAVLIFSQPSNALSSDSTASGLEQQLQALLAQKTQRSSDPGFLVHLANLYLDLGDDAYSEESKRRAAYEEGARIAREAINLQEQNAQAHYLYAANLGNAAQLKGGMASALTVSELKAHVRRALELKQDDAPALHMMGMMLEELPWFLGGNKEGALTYLKRAVAVDPGYTHARLDLAKAYIKRRDADAARRELAVILQGSLPSESSNKDWRHRDEASRLLASLRSR